MAVRRASGWCCREACPAGRIGEETWDIGGAELCREHAQQEGFTVNEPQAVKFHIPEPRMPTLDEHRAASAAWLSRMWPCLYENWPEALKALSFRTELVELTEADQTAIWAVVDGDGSAFPLLAKLDAALAAFGGEAFAKLSSRSPKDWWPEDGGPFRSGSDIVSAFAGSMRTTDDLIEYKYADAPCYLLLREYHAIPKHEEWRCFIRGGKVAGISQYHYGEHFPEMGAARDRCFDYLESVVLPALHVDTVVVDLWMKDEPLLIEINPYGSSDPCLFNYAELETAVGEFRVVEPGPTVTPAFLAAAEAEAATPITAISPEWLLKMAEREGGKCISVGGLVSRLEDTEPSVVADDGRPGGNGPIPPTMLTDSCAGGPCRGASAGADGAS